MPVEEANQTKLIDCSICLCGRRGGFQSEISETCCGIPPRGCLVDPRIDQ